MTRTLWSKWSTSILPATLTAAALATSGCAVHGADHFNVTRPDARAGAAVAAPTSSPSPAVPAPASPTAAPARAVPKADPTATSDPCGSWADLCPGEEHPGHTNYGPGGGPLITATNLGDGCDHNYAGEDRYVCIPIIARRAKDLDKVSGKPTDCATLRAGGYLATQINVIGVDDQKLDKNKDGIACGPGD